MILLQAQALSATRGTRTVLDRVDLTVASGEMVGILGPNGSGKTTLLRAALGVMSPSGGAAHLSGCPVADLSPPARARLVGYLPQERRLAWNVAAWRAASLGAPDLPPLQARAVALDALARVDLAALSDRGVFDMSGGERARVLLARLFATRAPLLVADEPSAGLDPEAQLLTMELLRAHATDGGGVAVTLHDLGLAARYCDRLVVLDHGRVAADGPPHDALAPAVLAAVFDLDGRLIDTEAGPVIAARRQETAA